MAYTPSLERIAYNAHKQVPGIAEEVYLSTFREVTKNVKSQLEYEWRIAKAILTLHRTFGQYPDMTLHTTPGRSTALLEALHKRTMRYAEENYDAIIERMNEITQEYVESQTTVATV